MMLARACQAQMLKLLSLLTIHLKGGMHWKLDLRDALNCLVYLLCPAA